MSTVVATKKALVEVLGLQPELTAVQITYADDVRAPRKERIFCGDVEEHDAEPVTMRAGRVRTEENYTLQVVISVTKKETEAAETRALALLRAVEEVLATDPKLSAASDPPRIAFATFAGFSLSSSLVGPETVSIIEAELRVKARNS